MKYYYPLLISCILSISGCKKKNEPEPEGLPDAVVSKVNNDHFSTNQPMPITLKKALESDFTFSGKGGYYCYTYTDTSYAPLSYQFIFIQGNIVAPGDTVVNYIQLASSQPISEDFYYIYGVGNAPASDNNIAIATYNRTSGEFESSDRIVGMIEIKKIDRINDRITGSIDYVDHGTPQSIPAKITVNTTFDCPLQELP